MFILYIQTPVARLAERQQATEKVKCLSRHTTLSCVVVITGMSAC